VQHSPESLRAEKFVREINTNKKDKFMEQQKQNVSLPDNAYRELKAGEEYKPLMSANSTPAEVTPYSVTMGIVMAIIFSAAAAFLGLKV
jgi:hypothetical protein